MRSIRKRCPRVFERMSAEAEKALLSIGTRSKEWPARLEQIAARFDLPSFLPDLMRLELAVDAAEASTLPAHAPSAGFEVNPSVHLLALKWRNLPAMLDSPEGSPDPEPGPELVLVWKAPDRGLVRFRKAMDGDLIALKVTTEQLDPAAVAQEYGRCVGVVDRALAEAVRTGLLLSPPSRLVMNADRASAGTERPRPPSATDTFSLQWHITQRCDLRCKHCYDRSDRTPLSLEKGLTVLDQLRAFCLNRFVSGQVSFTGGNPFLHPYFSDLYRAAFERHLQVAILGNPMDRPSLESIVAITTPAFYQVSLEGLLEHNDTIRGTGHFQRTLAFLDLLRELGVPSQVMLTLTRANADQVIPLGEILRGRADAFSFNRLAPFGEGALLEQADPQRYAAFCREYIEASRSNPVLGLKDNLLSLALQEQDAEPFGGCTGFGCGAAFNFLALLSDGEVHACRKLPSALGNIFELGLPEIYDSPLAVRYRQGCSGCTDCRLKALCGGCLAVSAGSGLDHFLDRDPFCWMESA